MEPAPDVLPDIGRPGLRVLFCGDQAGRLSAERGHYYARPGNRFWPSLFRAGLTSRLFTPGEDSELPELGIGLTNLKKTTVHGDTSPASGRDRARLLALVGAWRPAHLVFHGLVIGRDFFRMPRLGLGKVSDDITAWYPELAGTTIWLVSQGSGANAHFERQWAAGWGAFATALHSDLHRT